jgi:hypothetical protein
MPAECQADWLYTGLNVIESYSARNLQGDAVLVASDREYYDCFPNKCKCKGGKVETVIENVYNFPNLAPPTPENAGLETFGSAMDGPYETFNTNPSS